MQFYDHRDPTFLARLKNNLASSRSQLLQKDDSSTFKELSFVAMSLVLMAAFLFFSFGSQAAFHSVNQLSYALPANFLQMLTFLGDTLVCLALLLPFARRNPAMLVMALFTAVYGTLLCQGMKAYFDMPRPPAVLDPDAFFVTGDLLTRHSFPSGHSLTIFSLLTIFYYFSTQISTKLLLVLFGIAVASSRVLVGVHWPVDVLIGSALGIVVSLTAIQSAKYWRAGLTPTVHLFILALVLASTIMLFSHDGGYPGAKLFAMTLSCAALLHFFYDYVMFYLAENSMQQSLEND